uniref:Major capsid protein N-terminal domain-containing protein n=1 Tax=viral metagenome TaxID=1070528 RepID=A0A6C0AYZ9_9ZZZZ
MGGGLIQLVAYGAQDIYLTGQPQITFWKSVYRRHTNFAIESIQQTLVGSLNFGQKVSFVVSRNGDLLKRLWIQYNANDLLAGVNNNIVAANVGHALIDTIEILIGGQIIDKHYGKWLTIWNYLTDNNNDGTQGAIGSGHGFGPGEQPSPSGDTATNTFLPRPTKYQRMAYCHKANTAVVDALGAPLYAYVPLQFWFCKNPGLAIPLLALQYHEVSVNLTFAQYNGITNATPTGNEFAHFSIYADFVYLDTTERRQFAQNAHEYLIDQVQINSNNTKPVINLSFVHPVKELIWAIPPQPIVSVTYPAGSASMPSGFYKTTAAQPNNYKIIFNGTDRFIERDITYFTRNQVWESHTGFGSVLFPDSIGVYSFALKPEEHQPSGTANFSRLDTAQLSRTNTNPVDIIDVYAINYNVLRIVSGMGGLAYSN